MAAFEDVPDSTDWLPTPLAGLAPIESSLRCQVCKDFFNTPMMTSCSHTFCSLCIRRYLSQEGRCPACREADQEMKLRRNWTVEECVAQFTRCREEILAFARKPQTVVPSELDDLDSRRPKKRRKMEKVEAVNGTGLHGERRSTRSQSKRATASASQASLEPVSTQEEVADTEDEGSIYRSEQSPQRQAQPKSKESNDGLVPCPSCSRRIKEAQINLHLDRCLAGLPTSPDPVPARQAQSTTTTASVAFAQRTKSPTVTAQKERLPSINYALFTETSLRKKLKELGIPNHGNKELMRKRHIEWVNLWNANCDSARPKSKRDLLRELDIWERTLGRQIEKNMGSTGVMVKDFDRDGWVKTQKDDFDDLIRKAKEKRKAVVSEKKENSEDTEMQNSTNGVEDGMPQQPETPDQEDSDQANIEPAKNHTPTVLGVMANGDHKPALVEVLDLDRQPDTVGMPGTPPKLQPETSIDLTSSPAASIPVNGSQLTPGKQRSKFFV